MDADLVRGRQVVARARVDVVLHESDQMRLNNLPAGYRLFVPEFMAKGIWVQVQNYKRSPLSAHIMPDAEHEGRGEETQQVVGGRE